MLDKSAFVGKRISTL